MIFNAPGGLAPALTRHVNDKNNPHGVTAEQVGAAPAGYGYGGSAINIGEMADESALETALESLYSATTAVETKMVTYMGWEGWRWFGILSKSSPNNGSFVAHSAVHGGSKIIKTKNSGAWLPLEWENPPFALETEYRTTERYLGKPVYVKVFNFGALPNSTAKSITHNLTKTAVVALYASSVDGKYYIPSTSNSESLHLYINASYIVITSTGNWSSVNAYVTVKYTKD